MASLKPQTLIAMQQDIAELKTLVGTMPAIKSLDVDRLAALESKAEAIDAKLDAILALLEAPKGKK